MPKIYISSDHRGYESRQYLLNNFQLPAGYEWADLGPTDNNPDDDYNDAAVKVAKSVLADPTSLGVLICGSGHGIAIQANRFKGIRAIMGLNDDLARLGREHNNANILCLSADFQSFSEESSALHAFLSATFSGAERHNRRVYNLDKEY